MGDWYLINIRDLLSIGENCDFINSNCSSLILEYKSAELDKNNTFIKYGIDKILVKQIDFLGNSFREISTGIIIGSNTSGDPLAIESTKKRFATNEEIIEYLNYMQEVCSVLVTRFDLLNKLLLECYNLNKTSSDIVKKIIKNRLAMNNSSRIIEFPILNTTSAVKNISEENDSSNQKLTLLKGRER